MKPPFDIAGDLDTPVSAYAKLAAFRPRFLLESVEGGERLGRYSFIGFGEALEVRLDARSFTIGERSLARAAHCARNCWRDCAARSAQRRARCRNSARCRWRADWSATPRTMSCAISSACRNARRALPNAPPLLHYVAPHSLLVFDHLTRAIALLHAGSEAERVALRREVIRALRGPMPAPLRAAWRP